jgi:hypothetical protein
MWLSDRASSVQTKHRVINITILERMAAESDTRSTGRGHLHRKRYRATQWQLPLAARNAGLWLFGSLSCASPCPSFFVTTKKWELLTNVGTWGSVAPNGCFVYLATNYFVAQITGMVLVTDAGVRRRT